MSNKIFEALAIMTIIAVSVNAQNAEWYGAGGGKEGKTFHISTEDDLKGLAQLVNSGFDDFNGKTIILNADITLKGAHTPIGDDKKQFMGIFDGNGKTISNLSVSEVKYAGLFGYIEKGGQIKNLKVNVSRITGETYAGGLAGRYASTNAIENCGVNIKDSIFANSSRDSYSGGLVGQLLGRKVGDIIIISNSYVIGNISSKGNSGGLVGDAHIEITIKNSYTTGNIFGAHSGGLIGWVSNATITNSYATGNVSSFISGSGHKYSYSGGLVGWAGDITITNSYSTGNISALGSHSGGLVGEVSRAIITNSYATGNISSESFSGGLVGYGSNVTITDSYAAGNVSASSISTYVSVSHPVYSGGLIGSVETIKISNSYARGDISTRSNAVDRLGGGLIGSGNSIEIDNSYAEGNVSSSRVSGTSNANSSCTGGLIGKAIGGLSSRTERKIIISNSYAIGNVSGMAAKDIFSGGLIGFADVASTITNSYSSGMIIGTNRGGIMGNWKEGNNTSVYFNNTAGDMTAAFGLPAGLLGIGVTEEKLKNQETFKGWDFVKIWAINMEINDGYPYLRWSEKAVKEAFAKIKARKAAAEVEAAEAKARAEEMAKGFITDSRDRKNYKIAKIGSQVWMVENLNFNTNNSKCYDNKPANCNKYGRLYNWETAKTTCPSGWHLPSDEEWQELVDFAGGSEVAGKKLKAKAGWNDYEGKSGNGADAFGFAALPGGYGNSVGSFNDVGDYGNWWGSTENNASDAWNRGMGYFGDYVGRYGSGKRSLFSVRCVQDSAP
jgi:uncharacterized protein (TIGR02145 family)